MPHWKNVFIEVALYSLRKIHTKYQLWSLGTQENINFIGLNQYEGISLAYETDVCSAITQEFLSSVSRFKIDNTKNNLELYMLWREEAYKYNNDKRCDLIIQKVPTLNTNNKNDTYKKVYIEAKRWLRTSTNLYDTLKTDTSPQIYQIKKDIEKLQEEKKFNSDIYTCILIWGTSDEKSEIVLNEKSLSEYLIKNETITKYCPIKWNDAGIITKWMWVTLAEVK